MFTSMKRCITYMNHNTVVIIIVILKTMGQMFILIRWWVSSVTDNSTFIIFKGIGPCLLNIWNSCSGYNFVNHWRFKNIAFFLYRFFYIKSVCPGHISKFVRGILFVFSTIKTGVDLKSWAQEPYHFLILLCTKLFPPFHHNTFFTGNIFALPISR